MKPPKNIRCYDNDGKTADRYTVIFLDHPENQPGCFSALGMDARPFHPQGFGQHTSAMPGRHLGRRIAFAKLPPDCQRLVDLDLRSAKSGTWKLVLKK